MPALTTVVIKILTNMIRMMINAVRISVNILIMCIIRIFMDIYVYKYYELVVS